MKWQNNQLISFLQAFGIIGVVMGHSFYKHEEFFIFQWIYSFHMPLFFFISGYLLKYTNEQKEIHLADISLYGYKGFIMGKIKRLLIPYVVISSLALIPKSLLNSFAARPVDLTIAEYGRMLAYPWDNVIIFFWFLPTLFCIFIIISFASRVFSYLKCRIPFLLFLALLLLLHLFNPLKGVKIFNLEGVASYLFYFALGYYVCYKGLMQGLIRHLIFVTFILFLFSIVFLYIPVFDGKDVLVAINGIVLSICLGRIYVIHNYTFLNHLFGASYAIYLFSWFPQVMSQQVLLSLTCAHWWIGTCLAVLSGLYVPVLIYRWILRNKEKKWGSMVAILTGQ